MLHIGNKSINLAVKKAGVLYVGTRKMGPIIDESSEPTPSGTVLHLYDRVDGKATVAGFWTDGNGQRYAVCVADAAYRTGGQLWSNSTVDTPLPNYTKRLEALATTDSATFNMDTIRANYTLSDYPAFNLAYSNTIELDGVTYNGLLPNASELQMIYNDRTTLDTYDETLSSYPSNSLTTWNINGNSRDYCWSSTEYGSARVWIETNTGSFSSGNDKHANNYGVIPIFEIPVDENGRVM